MYDLCTRTRSNNNLTGCKGEMKLIIIHHFIHLIGHAQSKEVIDFNFPNCYSLYQGIFVAQMQSPNRSKTKFKYVT